MVGPQRARDAPVTLDSAVLLRYPSVVPPNLKSKFVHRLRLSRSRRGVVARVRLARALTALALALTVSAQAEAQSAVVVNVKVRDELRTRSQLDQVLRGHGSPQVRALFADIPAVQMRSL